MNLTLKEALEKLNTNAIYKKQFTPLQNLSSMSQGGMVQGPSSPAGVSINPTRGSISTSSGSFMPTTHSGWADLRAHAMGLGAVSGWSPFEISFTRAAGITKLKYKGLDVDGLIFMDCDKPFGEVLKHLAIESAKGKIDIHHIHILSCDLALDLRNYEDIDKYIERYTDSILSNKLYEEKRQSEIVYDFEGRVLNKRKTLDHAKFFDNRVHCALATLERGYDDSNYALSPITNNKITNKIATQLMVYDFLKDTDTIHSKSLRLMLHEFKQKLSIPTELNFLTPNQMRRIELIKAAFPELRCTNLEFWQHYETMRLASIAENEAKRKGSKEQSIDSTLFE